MSVALIIVIILLVLAAVARFTGWPDSVLLVLFAIAIILLTGVHI